jgi:hypothetical protein
MLFNFVARLEKGKIMLPLFAACQEMADQILQGAWGEMNFQFWTERVSLRRINQRRLRKKRKLLTLLVIISRDA